MSESTILNSVFAVYFTWDDTMTKLLVFAWVCALSRIQPFATPSTVALQAPLSMEFSRQELWDRLPFSTLGDLPDPGIKHTSLVSPGSADRMFPTVPLGTV